MTFHPVGGRTLAKKQKKDAISVLMLLKEKRCGKVKGSACVHGRKQREGSKNYDATSPTVATESVLITASIDAIKRRNIAVVDTPGAFLKTPMDEDVYLCSSEP